MLDYMRESLAIAMKYKEGFDEELENTVILTICVDILNEYILLVPTEKNIKDAGLLVNLDQTRVIMEFTNNQTFNLYDLIKSSDDIEYVVSFIKENSIIVKQDKRFIDEFNSIVKVADDLSGEYKLHLNSRNLIHKNRGLLNEMIEEISSYWKGTVLGQDIQVQELDFSSKILLVANVHSTIYFPVRDMHSRGPLRMDDFYFEHKSILFEHLRKEKFLFRTLALSRMTIFVSNDSYSEYFSNQPHGTLFSLNQQTRRVLIEKNSKKDYIEWTIKRYVNARDFIELLEKDFL